ncbi:MAG: hypothetical protein KGI69_03590 [Patescibacteria group bacterium]|nr:hypothetical protein [Patescibacteria group bacterium]
MNEQNTNIKKEVLANNTELQTASSSSLFAAKPKTMWGKISNILVEILAPLIWIYVFVKIFVFDIDNYLVNRFFPSFASVLDFKFLILLGLLALILVTVKNKTFLKNFFYVLFYPLILILFGIPYFIFKQRSWVLAFAFINSVITFFRTFKFNVVILAVYLITFVLSVYSSNHSILWGTTGILILVLTILYVRKFLAVFQPSMVFKTYLKFFPAIRKAVPTSFALDPTIKSLPIESLDTKQKDALITNLQQSVLYNRACLFVSKKLQIYQNSKLNYLSYSISLILLIVATVLTFGVVNFALFKIDHSLFAFSQYPITFDFFYYSFSNLFHAPPNFISAISPLSQGSIIVETIFEFLLLGLLISLFFSVKNEKYSVELNEVVKGLSSEGDSMESFIKEEYKLGTLKDAINRLIEAKAGLIRVVLWFTKNID